VPAIATRREAGVKRQAKNFRAAANLWLWEVE
jgi:hypothetical protein